MGRRGTNRRSSAVWRRIGMAAALAAVPLADCRRCIRARRIRTACWCSPRTRPSAPPKASPRCRRPRRAEATFDVTADASRFTDAGLAPYKAVVFLNTTGERARRRPAGGVREVLQGRGRLPRRRLGDRRRARLAVHDRPARHAQAQRRRGHAGDDRGRRSRSLGRQGSSRVLAAHRSLVQLHRQRPRRLARHRDRRRGHLHGRQHQRRGLAQRRPSRRSGARTTRAAAPSTPRSATPPRASPSRTSASISAAPSSGRPARPTRSTATAARPCSPTTSRPRSRPRRT